MRGCRPNVDGCGFEGPYDPKFRTRLRTRGTSASRPKHLRRQPGRLQRVREIGAIPELFEPDDFAFAELPRHEDRVADPGVAPWHRPRKTALADDLVAPVVQSENLVKGAGHALPLLSQHVDEFGVPSPGARLKIGSASCREGG